MLESAEIGHKLPKEDWEREEPKLREALLNVQYDLLEAKRFPVLVIMSGVETGGRGETANKLTEWMDPRHIRVRAFGPREPEEHGRPMGWRYWRAFPQKGRIGIFMNAWYHDAMRDRIIGHLDEYRFERELERIRHLERMLVEEGTLVLKFWIHLPKDEQKKRLKKLERHRNGIGRITKEDWERFRVYNRSRDVAERMLRETSTAEAPWAVVEGTDERYRFLTVGKIMLEAMTHRLKQPFDHERRATAPPTLPVTDNRKLIRDLDLSKKLDRVDYERSLSKWQGKLARQVRCRTFMRDRSLVLVFEGTDAAGKGGAVRRVVAALDARQYAIVAVSAPSDEERAQPYLWRFWRRLPRAGGVTIFDRSWYGRVLVERVEGFCSAADWLRGYVEINDFEEQLADAGAVVVKFWLQIGKEEQLRRFRAREKTAFKRFKITAEDWRNRKQWNAYEQAVCDMIDRTSTEISPWTIVEAEDKQFARVKVLRTICERLEAAL
ncbi:MAG: polyphosphate:AMP phosphotransferase [Burkholderiales bacterium]